MFGLLAQLEAVNRIACSHFIQHRTGRPIVPTSTRQRILSWAKAQEMEFTAAECGAEVEITGTLAAKLLYDLAKKSGAVERVKRTGFSGWKAVGIELRRTQ